MKYFIDTEFNEETDPVGLISLGVVAEDGREFYAIDQQYQDWSSLWQTTNTWVRKHVRPILMLDDVQPVIGNKEVIRNALQTFIGRDSTPEFWGYFADYDWFLVCRLFGNFTKLPTNWPYLCYDVRQFQKHKGITNLPTKFTPEHNALIDARWTKHAFEYIQSRKTDKEPSWP